MSQTKPGPACTCIANGAITRGRRVKLSSRSNDSIVVATAGAGERSIGIAKEDAADGAFLSVEMNAPGKTMTVVTAGAYAFGTDVYGAASGKVQSGASGAKCFMLLEASSGDGAEVEALWLAYEA